MVLKEKGICDSISFESSIDVVCNLVQVSISEVCSYRGLLGSTYFKMVSPPALRGMEVHVLRDEGEDCPQSCTVNQWICSGLKEALMKRVLRKMTFGVAKDEKVQNILEEYIFEFREPEGHRKEEPIGLQHQVVKILETIVTLSKTLEDVPEGCFLFMKLYYHDGCPADYEPMSFEDANDRGVGYFYTKPFELHMGSLLTAHHWVVLGIKSVLDSVDVIPGLGKTADDISIREESSTEADHSSDQKRTEDSRSRAADDMMELFSETQNRTDRIQEMLAEFDPDKTSTGVGQQKKVKPTQRFSALFRKSAQSMAKGDRDEDHGQEGRMPGTNSKGKKNHYLVTPVDPRAPKDAKKLPAVTAMSPSLLQPSPRTSSIKKRKGTLQRMRAV